MRAKPIVAAPSTTKNVLYTKTEEDSGFDTSSSNDYEELPVPPADQKRNTVKKIGGIVAKDLVDSQSSFIREEDDIPSDRSLNLASSVVNNTDPAPSIASHRDMAAIGTEENRYLSIKENTLNE